MQDMARELAADPARVEQLLRASYAQSARLHALEAQIAASYDRIRTHAQAARATADLLAERAEKMPEGEPASSMRMLAVAMRTMAEMLEKDLLRWERP